MRLAGSGGLRKVLEGSHQGLGYRSSWWCRYSCSFLLFPARKGKSCKQPIPPLSTCATLGGFGAR